MFYEFYQNNSDGHFLDDSVNCRNVIIEADSADDANLRAKEIGLYFDGVLNGSVVDCICCGDRWYRVYDNDPGTETPQVCGVNNIEDEPRSVTDRVFYKNGAVETYYYEGKFFYDDED